MPTSLSEIAGFLREMNLNFEERSEPPCIVTGFQTKKYRNAHGHDGIMLVIAVEENGEFLKIFAPMLYRYKRGPYSEALMETLLHICYLTKMLQFEYDSDDGEVRAMIEFPIEDSRLTARQLGRCIAALAQFADEFHAMILGAIEQGRRWDDEATLREGFEKWLRDRAQQRGDIGLGE